MGYSARKATNTPIYRVNESNTAIVDKSLDCQGSYLGINHRLDFASPSTATLEDPSTMAKAVTPQEWAMLKANRQQAFPQLPPLANGGASLGSVRVKPLSVSDQGKSSTLQSIPPKDSQSMPSKVGAGEARQTRNSTVHSGNDDVAITAATIMSKDEIRAEERAQAYLKTLGIEVPIKNRQALALMRGDPEDSAEVPLCANVLALIPAFLEASTLQWNANTFLKGQD